MTDDDPYEPGADNLIGGILAGATELCAPAGATAAADGGRRELAERCIAIDRAITYLGTVREHVGEALAELMEDTREELVGTAVLERHKTNRVEWDKDAVQRDLTRSLTHRHAVNPETGEVITNLARLVETVVNSTTAAFTPTPRVAGLKMAELDPNDYRATSWGPWKVKVTPIKVVAP